MRALRGGNPTGTDAEACAYLYTAALTQPMSQDWGQIYLYIAGKVYEKWHTKESGVTMPDDIRVDSISDDQMRDLNRLKAWLYHKRTTVRLDRDRAKRQPGEKQNTPHYSISSNQLSN